MWSVPDLVVVTADPFGDQHRFFLAFALHDRVPGDLRAAVELLVFSEREARAHPRAARHRRGEAHPVEPVVDAHLAVGEREGALGEMREQRQGEKAVGDGAAEGRALRALAVDVDPLEVVDRLGEAVDARLRDLEPRRDADLLADARLEVADRSGLQRRHVATPRAMACAMRAWTFGSRILVSSAGLTMTPASNSTEGMRAVCATARLS